MKKYYYIIVLTLVLAMLLLLTSCNDENQIVSQGSTENNIYATQRVEDTTENSIEYTNTTEASIDSSDPLPMYYNVKQDENAMSITDMNTISIDGKLVSFPCTYDDIIEKFGTLYTINTQKYTIKTDLPADTIGVSFEAHAMPTTGEGEIIFLFKSKDNTECPISQMVCYGFEVQAGSNYNAELMTFALPHLITFGSSYDQIISEFGTNGKKHTQHDNADYMIIYDSENESYRYTFIGYDNGLYLAKIEYEK